MSQSLAVMVFSVPNFGYSDFLVLKPVHKSWSRRYAERIWGEFFIWVWRIVGKLMANFDGEF